jgi:hypothetical protein
MTGSFPEKQAVNERHAAQTYCPGKKPAHEDCGCENRQNLAICQPRGHQEIGSGAGRKDYACTSYRRV